MSHTDSTEESKHKYNSSVAASVNEKRKELVDLYEKGVNENDILETSKEQSSGNINRYGFIGSKIVRLTPQQLDTERMRQNSWLKILSKWEENYPSKNLKKKVFGGIPDSLRGEVWKRILEVPHEISANESHYEHLKFIAKETSTDLYQIDLDINRTYRNHVMYRPRYSVKQKSLFYVLGSYAEHNKDVGYCQGMANVAALLLMYMDEEDAFWSLSTLLTGKKYSMHGFFVPGFPKLLRFQIHHEKILKKLLPKLFNHLETQGVKSSLYTLKWYMQCFLDRLPFGLTLRLWDLFILEGDKILHPVGYTLLKLNAKELLKMDMEHIAHFLSTGLSEMNYDPDNFMNIVSNNIDELKKYGLYPAPSVVEGELPQNSNLVFSTLNERTMNKSRVAMQIMEIENKISCDIYPNTGSVDEFDTVTSTNKYENSSLDNESQTNSYKRPKSLLKTLPKGIPPPPNYTAPTPIVSLDTASTYTLVNNSGIKLTNHNHKQRAQKKIDISTVTSNSISIPQNSLYNITNNLTHSNGTVNDEPLDYTSKYGGALRNNIRISPKNKKLTTDIDYENGTSKLRHSKTISHGSSLSSTKYPSHEDSIYTRLKTSNNNAKDSRYSIQNNSNDDTLKQNSNNQIYDSKSRQSFSSETSALMSDINEVMLYNFTRQHGHVASSIEDHSDRSSVLDTTNNSENLRSNPKS